MKNRLCFAQQVVCRVSLVALVAVLLATLAVGAWGQGMNRDPVVEKSLQVGGSDVMDFDTIKRAAVSDPTVVDYVVLSAKQIMITAKKPGTSTLNVWDNKGQHTFNVTVVAPPSHMPEIVQQIEDAIASPAIKVSAHGEVVILEGEVEDAQAAKRAEAIARAYAPQVESLIQVRMEPEKPPIDLDAIRNAVGPGIKVTALTDKTLLFEGAATPEQKARVDQILAALGATISVVDNISTPAQEPRQIVVRVKVLDINKAALSDIGVDWGGLSQTREVEYDAGGNKISDVLTNEFHEQPILFGEVFGIGSDPFKAVNEGGPIRRIDLLGARLKALVTNNRARVLAEPNLLVVEGETAEILVGGEIPIPVVQSVSGVGAAAAGAVTVEWKEFGVKLTIKGLVGEDGKTVDLDVTPEVSSLDYANAIVVSGIVLPALRTRRAHSILHMDDGQTLVIGGLYQVEWSKSVRKVPLLGDLPIIGELFKRTDKQRRETELVILVTPEIVTEASAAARTDAALERVGEEP